MSKHKASKVAKARGVRLGSTIRQAGAPKPVTREVIKLADPKAVATQIVAESKANDNPTSTRSERSAINKAKHAAAKVTKTNDNPAPKAKDDPKPATSKTSGEQLYRTKTGKKSHRKGCRFVTKNAYECKDTPIDRKLAPCAVCKPHLPASMLERAIPKATLASLRPCKVCNTGCSHDVRFTREHAESVGFVFTTKGTAFHKPECRCVTGRVVASTGPSKKQAGSRKASKTTTSVHPLSREGQATAIV